MLSSISRKHWLGGLFLLSCCLLLIYFYSDRLDLLGLTVTPALFPNNAPTTDSPTNNPTAGPTLSPVSSAPTNPTHSPTPSPTATPTEFDPFRLKPGWEPNFFAALFGRSTPNPYKAGAFQTAETALYFAEKVFVITYLFGIEYFCIYYFPLSFFLYLFNLFILFTFMTTSYCIVPVIALFIHLFCLHSF
jgi:hypothetical protein